MTGDVRLHVPDEPDREPWRTWVFDQGTPEEVIQKDQGIAGWLWERWRVLDRVGIDRTRFQDIVGSYQRELWLWLMGERTWDQCCSGLVGRIHRRLASP